MPKATARIFGATTNGALRRRVAELAFPTGLLWQDGWVVGSPTTQWYTQAQQNRTSNTTLSTDLVASFRIVCHN
jgi:hypothetical protein